MSKVLWKIPFIGGLFRKLSFRRKKNEDGDSTMYPLY